MTEVIKHFQTIWMTELIKHWQIMWMIESMFIHTNIELPAISQLFSQTCTHTDNDTQILPGIPRLFTHIHQHRTTNNTHYTVDWTMEIPILLMCPIVWHFLFFFAVFLWVYKMLRITGYFTDLIQNITVNLSKLLNLVYFIICY